MTVHEPLEAALHAATAPGHPEELAGEDAAVAAFRAAALVPHRPFLTMKVLVIGIAAASTAGVLVVVTSLLPSSPREREPASVPSVGTTRMSTSVSVPLPSGPAVPPPDPHTTDTATPLPPSAGPTTSAGPDDDEEGHSGHGRGRDRDGRHGKSGRYQTPGSPTQGGVTAVPPSGAEPPSPGG